MLNDTLIKNFPELNDPNNHRKMKWLKPDDKVALLAATFKCNPSIRHIPILSANPGQLKALISRIDFEAFVTPPVGKLHATGLLSDDTNKAIASFIKEVGKEQIQNEFSSLFQGETKELSATKNTVREAISGLTELQIVDPKNSRRYRTLPVFDNNRLLVGMLSYTNILKKIKETTAFAPFLNRQVTQIYKPANDLTTLNEDDSFLQAMMILDGAPFTHIPIMKPGDNSRIVTGLIDDLIIARYQHPLLLEALAEKPLKNFQTCVDDQNIVQPQQTISDVIDKLLTINYPDRPTAILVCTKTNNDEFVLQGIVSYADILRKFVAWWDGQNQANNQAPVLPQQG